MTASKFIPMFKILELTFEESQYEEDEEAVAVGNALRKKALREL